VGLKGLNEAARNLTFAVSLSVDYVEGEVRLEGSEVDYEGRLEIYHSGQWGTVCSHGFDNLDARVACRNLGLGFVSVLLFMLC